jgi:hypothetical protein
MKPTTMSLATVLRPMSEIVQVMSDTLGATQKLKRNMHPHHLIFLYRAAADKHDMLLLSLHLTSLHTLRPLYYIISLL